MNIDFSADFVHLTNQTVSLSVPRHFGPRIMQYRLHGHPTPFAELPHFWVPLPDGQRYHFYGGHRLWHGPEAMPRTYQPEDSPVEVIPIARGVRVTQATERATGVQKSLEITLPDEGSGVRIDHRLTNQTMWPIPCCAWAITQLRLGGTLYLPQSADWCDPDGMQANRFFALWPYSRWPSAQLQWEEGVISLRAEMAQGERFKLGYPNRANWLGYAWAGLWFVKSADYDPLAHYEDGQSSSTVYLDHQFAELETLSPRQTIPPHGEIMHREWWWLSAEQPTIPLSRFANAMLSSKS